MEEAAGTTMLYQIGSQNCLGLIGSIGLDSAITIDGTFLIEAGLEDDVSRKAATPKERTWLIVCAQRRRFPEFSVLLPLRPKNAIDCDECQGTGFIFINTVICSSCAALGWLAKDGT